MTETTTERRCRGPACRPGLDPKCWRLDGRRIGQADMEIWNGLDWSKARLDMGPSPAGNSGPYWHVPYEDGDTVHRLYPKWLTP